VLEGISDVEQRADYILHGHAGDVEDISLLDKLINGLKDIAAGKTEQDTEYKWFGGISKQHPFDEGSVIVYGDNIK